MRLTCNVCRAGGFTFLSDPSLNLASAAPIWSAALDPCVIRVAAHPCANRSQLRFDLSTYDYRVALSPAGEHLLLRVQGTSLRLDVVAGTILSGPVRLEPRFDLERLNVQIAAIRKLEAMIRHMLLPKQKDGRLAKLILALRALDARAEGASLREVARGIFGSSDWPGDGESIKSRARRLVGLAQELKQAGPAGVFARAT